MTPLWPLLFVASLSVVSGSGHGGTGSPGGDPDPRAFHLVRAASISVDFRVTQLCFSPAGDVLALAGKRAALVAPDGGKPVVIHAEPVKHIAWSPGGGSLLLVTRGRSVLRYWRATSILDTLLVDAGPVPPIWFSEDVFAVHQSTGAWRVWGDPETLDNDESARRFYYHAACQDCPGLHATVFEGDLHLDGTVSVTPLPAPTGHDVRFVFYLGQPAPGTLAVRPVGSGEVVVMRPSGETLSAYEVPFDVTDLSTDGQYGVGMRMRGGEDGDPLRSDLWLLDMAAGTTYALHDTPREQEIHPVFSPDGAFVASVEGEGAETIYLDRVVAIE